MASTGSKSLLQKPAQPKRKLSAKAKRAKEKATQQANAEAGAKDDGSETSGVKSPKSRKTPKSKKASEPGSPQTSSLKGTTLTAVARPASDPDPISSPVPGKDLEMSPRQNFDDIAEPETPVAPPDAAQRKAIAASMQSIGPSTTPQAEQPGERTQRPQQPRESKAEQFYQASLGDLDKIKRMIADNIDVDMVVEDPRDQGCTALLWASFYGKLAIVKELIKAKADISKTSLKHGHTAVFCAAQTGRVEVLTYLLKLGANADTANRHGATPLFMAVQGNNLDVLRTLLENGANVNATTSDGQSALTKASQKSLIPIVKMLLEYGADVYNKAGKYRPLRVAKQQAVKDMLNDNITLQKGGSVDSGHSARSDSIPREHTQMRGWEGQRTDRKSCIVM